MIHIKSNFEATFARILAILKARLDARSARIMANLKAALDARAAKIMANLKATLDANRAKLLNDIEARLTTMGAGNSALLDKIKSNLDGQASQTAPVEKGAPGANPSGPLACGVPVRRSPSRRFFGYMLRVLVTGLLRRPGVHRELADAASSRPR
jgi:hypothetical protein